ncbi:TetR/AcrR family transcriptional regulator [Mycolicibacterium septicum DSM 44393]|uniref:TetR/AcrR family transcriptional regulator n=1 Tax=Mycolicibacterium septicum DSM 44393 TaxID=1341646 RepID=A0A7X6MNA0_9MYCO|nr:TetR family transcriptional regulator [Mycolicibacterium septicum]NKZ10893.1 TetR/AcrR family transcriptional regulator [Mycolicibacterium septicum DSM 44393]
MSRPYRGQAADARSADRRARLLQAGVDLVGTQGVAAMTMRAVCREAELSQKFFYESFTGTDDLLQEVYRSTFEQARRVVNAAGDPEADLTSRTRAGVYAAAQLVRDDPRVCRILLVEPIADLTLRQFVRDTIGTMTMGGLTAPTGGTAARAKMQYATVFGAIISLFIEWTEGNLGSDQEAFVDHVTTMLLSSPLFGGRGAVQAVPSAGHPARTPRINRSS